MAARNFSISIQLFIFINLEIMCHLSTPNENATLCSLLNGIICVYSTGFRNGKNQAKTFSLLYDTRANCKYIKNIPPQYFTCYIKSWKWIVLRWLIFLHSKLNQKKFLMAFTWFSETDSAQASALGSALKWLNLPITKGPWALSCLPGFVDSSFSRLQHPDSPPTQTDVHKTFKVKYLQLWFGNKHSLFLMGWEQNCGGFLTQLQASLMFL